MNIINKQLEYDIINKKLKLLSENKVPQKFISNFG